MKPTKRYFCIFAEIYLYNLIPQKMYKITSLLYLCSILSFSQVGINTTDPHPSSIMEIHATDKGLLIPRVNLNNKLDVSTIQSPAEGLFVFHSGNEEMVRGFYYWANMEWHYLNSDMKDAWLLEGNSIINPDNAIGTNNSMALKLKTNNKVIAEFNPDGGFVIGMDAVADASNAIAIGRIARAVEPQNIAIGMGSNSTGTLSFALGTYSQALGDFSTALGTNSQGRGYSSTAIGHTAIAMSDDAVAIGGGTLANRKNAIAIGSYAEATEKNSFALGPKAKAWAENSFALGIGTKADVANTIILGGVPEPDVVGVIPVNVGIGTTNPQGRLDVNGNFKLGVNGNVLKGISAFSAQIVESTIVLGNNHFIKEFVIPELARPLTTQGVIQYTIGEVNDDLSVQWARFSGNGTIRVKFKNDLDTDVDINGLVMNFTITEF